MRRASSPSIVDFLLLLLLLWLNSVVAVFCQSPYLTMRRPGKPRRKQKRRKKPTRRRKPQFLTMMSQAYSMILWAPQPVNELSVSLHTYPPYCSALNCIDEPELYKPTASTQSQSTIMLLVTETPEEPCTPEPRRHDRDVKLLPRCVTTLKRHVTTRGSNENCDAIRSGDLLSWWILS